MHMHQIHSIQSRVTRFIQMDLTSDWKVPRIILAFSSSFIKWIASSHCWPLSPESFVETMSGVDDGNTILGTRLDTSTLLLRRRMKFTHIHTIIFTRIQKPQRLLNLGNVGADRLTTGVVDTFTKITPTSFNEPINKNRYTSECFEMASAACTDGRTKADHIWLKGFHLDELQKSKS